MVWVGGMVFGHYCMRPAAAVLEPPQRIALMAAALARFFRIVAHAVAVLVVTGYALVFLHGGFAGWGWHVHVMNALGLVMAALFVFLWFGPRRRLDRAVTAADWPAARAALDRVRRVVTVNIALGVVVVAIATGGRWVA